MGSLKFWRVFRYRNFSLFALAQTISQLGDRLNNMALLALIGTHVAGSALAFSELAVFIALPVLIFGPLSGILVDRWNRKHVLVFVDASRALVVALIPLSFYLTRNFTAVNALVFVIFLLGLFFNSAKMAIIPSLVGMKEEILEANAVANFTGRFATLAGLMFGGIAVELALWKRLGVEGWAMGFYADALTYAVSAAAMALLVLPRSAVKPRAASIDLWQHEMSFFRKAISDVKEAAPLFWKHRPVKLVTLSLVGLVIILGAAYTLVIIHAQQILGFGTKGVGILGGSTGLGLIVGAYVFGVWGSTIGKGRAIVFGLFALAVILTLSAFTGSFRLNVVLFFAAGAIISPVIIAQDTILQEDVPDEARGRVFSVKELVWSGGFLGTSLLLGGAAETLKHFLSIEDTLRTLIVTVSSVVVLSLTAYFLVNRRSANDRNRRRD